MPNDEKKPGAYMLHNLQTGYGYVGSTHDLDFRVKTHQQLLKNGKHPNKRLQAQFDVNPNFDAVVLPLEDREVAFDLEQALLDEHALNPFLLNVSRDARYCRVPGLKHSDETKAKISAASKGNQYRLGHVPSEETKKKLREANAGKPIPDERRERIRQSHIGKTHSEETKQKIRELKTGIKRDPAAVEATAAKLRGRPISEAHRQAIIAAKAKKKTA